MRFRHFRVRNQLQEMALRGGGGFVGGVFAGSGGGDGPSPVDPWGAEVVTAANLRTRPATCYDAAAIVTNAGRSDDAALTAFRSATAARALGYTTAPVTAYAPDIDSARTAATIIDTCCIFGVAGSNNAYFDRAIDEALGLATWPTTGTQFLTIAERARGLAIAYEYCYARMTSGQRSSIATALLTQFLVPFISGSGSNPSLWYQPNATFQSNPNNWATVVNGTAMLAALTLSDTWASANIALNQARAGLDVYFSTFTDGSSLESPSYGGGYALGFAVLALDSLVRATVGSKTSIGDDDGTIGLIAEWYSYQSGLTGYQFDHSDGATKADPHDLSLFSAGARFSVAAAQSAGRILSSIGTFPILQSGLAYWSGPANNNGMTALTASKKWDISREVRLSTGWTGQPILWTRGGVGSWSHACQDRGVVCLDLGGVRWTQGNDLYGQGLTRPASDFAVLVINGAAQSLNGSATIETGNTVLSGSHPRTVVDCSNVSAPTSQPWRRRCYIEDDYTVLVTDQFTGGSGQPYAWYWPVAGLTTAPAGAGTRTVTLSKGGKQLLLYAPSGSNWTVAPAGTNNSGQSVYKMSLAGTCTGSSQRLDIYAQLVDASAPDVTTLTPPAMP